MIRLSDQALEHALESAFLAATDAQRQLPRRWVDRSERLRESPSVGFIAAVGAVLLAKATDPRIDAFVIQAREGGAGAYSLRKPATVLARKRHVYGYDIGSSSDRDPINHGTLVSSKRWDVALDRIHPRHKPFFQIILQWLADIDQLSQEEALDALAAYVRARRAVAPGAAIGSIPEAIDAPPSLSHLVDVLEGFVSADPEEGARGMALTAAAFRAAGLDADVPSRNDPRRIDVPIRRDGMLVIGSEVKQLATDSSTTRTLVADALSHGMDRALLVVLRPGIVRFDRSSEIRWAEQEHGIVLRIVDGVRELMHEALTCGGLSVEEFRARLPRAFAAALRDIRAADETVETWAALARQWAAP